MPELSFHVFQCSPSFVKWFWFLTCMTFEVFCTTLHSPNLGGEGRVPQRPCTNLRHTPTFEQQSCCTLSLLPLPMLHQERRRGCELVFLGSFGQESSPSSSHCSSVQNTKEERPTTCAAEKPQTRAPSCVQCSLLLVLFHWFILLGRV